MKLLPRLRLLTVSAATLCVVSTLLVACHHDEPATETTKSSVSGETVTLAKESAALIQTTAVIQAPEQHPTLPGRLTWDEDRTVRVLTPFAGRVADILVKVGETVQQGQPLATLLSPDFGAAQAEARKAQTTLSLAQRVLNRQKDLAAHGVAAVKDVEQAEADFASAKAEVERTQARLKLVGDGREAIDQRFSLKSPIAGVVVERNINPGQELRPDQPGLPLFVVTDPKSLWVSLDATESDVAPVKPGATLQLFTQELPGESFAATLYQVADFVDPVTRTIKLRGRVDNSDRRLKGEMYVTARLPSPPSNALAAPAATVFLMGTRHYAFVVSGENRYTRRVVEADFTPDGYAVFSSGVSAGDKLVSDGALFLERILEQSEAEHAADTTPAKPAS